MNQLQRNYDKYRSREVALSDYVFVHGLFFHFKLDKCVKQQIEKNILVYISVYLSKSAAELRLIARGVELWMLPGHR